MLLKKISLLASAMLLLLHADGQWQQLYNVGTHNHGTMVMHNGTLYLSNYGAGLYSSTTGGQSWNLVGDPVPGTDANNISAVGTDGSYLFVGSDEGIFRSADGGNTWSPANGSLAASQNAWAKRFKLIDGILFMWLNETAPNGGGLFSTTDHGNTWVDRNTGLPPNDHTIWGLTKRNNALHAAAANSFFISTNNGASWTTTYTPLFNIPQSIEEHNGRLAATTYGFNSTFIYSDDGGYTWTNAAGGTIEGGENDQVIYFNGLWVANEYGSIHWSNDNAASWNIYDVPGLSTLVRHLYATDDSLYAETFDSLWVLAASNIGIAEPTNAPVVKVAYSSQEGAVFFAGSVVGGPFHVRIMDAAGRILAERDLAPGTDRTAFHGSSGLYTIAISQYDRPLGTRSICVMN